MGLMGSGILKGMGVTLRHFIDTYATDLMYALNKGGVQQPRPLRRQSPKHKGMVTVEYPKERLPLPENFRYVPFLVQDTKADDIKCTSCGICAKVCPPQCIWIVRTEDPVTKRPVPQPHDFFIDATICMNCGYCAEFCPFDAIKMDHDYELSYYPQQQPHARLVEDKNELLKPDTYHASIHPTDWARELADKAAEDEKKRAAAAKAGGPPPAKPTPAVAAAPATASAAKPAGGPPPVVKSGGPPPVVKSGGPPPVVRSGGPPPVVKPAPSNADAQADSTSVEATAPSSGPSSEPGSSPVPPPSPKPQAPATAPSDNLPPANSLSEAQEADDAS